MDVWDPFAFFPRVIEVKHGSHCIHPQSVNVVTVEPKQGIGYQEGFHLVPAIVENGALPVRVETLAGVRMIVEVRAVKICQPVGIGWEVGRHPVQDDPNAGLMEGVHEVHKFLRSAISAGRGKVAGDLVAPAWEIGVFHNRQKLNMSEAHFLYIADHFISHFLIAQAAQPSVGLFPGTHVDLVH